MDNWISSQSSQTISVDASAEKYYVQYFSCSPLILYSTAGGRICSLPSYFFLWACRWLFFFLICLLILICRISDDTLRITTLGFFYSQLTDETAAYRVICCLLYRFISNAIKARAVHCFHNSIPVTTALEEYAISQTGSFQLSSTTHWGGP